MQYKKDYKDEVDSFYDDQAKSEKSDFEDFLNYMDGKDAGGASKKEIILDLDSNLESFLTGMIIISACAAFGMFLSSFSAASLMSWIFIPLILLVVFVVLRFNVDDYYILNGEEKKIYFRRKLFRNEEKKPVADFSDIFAATTAGKRVQQSKHKFRWDYAALIVLKDGKMIRVTNYAPEGYGRATMIAKQASEFLDIPYMRGELETYTRVQLNNSTGEPELFFDNYLVHFIKYNLMWYAAGIIIFLLFVLRLGR